MRLEFENATELSESRGLEIGFKGFKTNPADAEHLPTQIYIEFYDGKIQVHLWNGDSQDPQTILIHPDTPEAIFEANKLYVKESSLPEVAELVRAESDVYVIEINGRELGRGATEAEAWQNAASAIRGADKVA